MLKIKINKTKAGAVSSCCQTHNFNISNNNQITAYISLYLTIYDFMKMLVHLTQPQCKKYQRLPIFVGTVIHFLPVK